MKIVKNNPNQLVLHTDPTAQIIFGFVFILAGLAITFLMARSVDISCQPAGSQTINCQLSDKLLGAVPVGQRTVNGIQGAAVRENHGSKDNSTTYRVVFVTGGGDVSLTGYSDGAGGKTQIAEQINNFVRNGQGTWNFQLPMNGLVLIFLFVFGGVGLAIMLLAQSVNIEMNRSEGKLRIRKEGLVGGGQQEYALSEIQGISLQSRLTHHHGHNNHVRANPKRKTYRIVLSMASNQEIPLDGIYSSDGRSQQKIVDAMHRFLGASNGVSNRFQNQEPFE